MNTRRMVAVVLVAGSTAIMQTQPCTAQCCLTDFFAGLCSCCQTAPPRPMAVAPVMAQPIPVVAPVVAPAAPPQPVMVPVQQVSYVPETCYKTQYECVPVTCYRPVTEVDPCTGHASQCMQQETTYVQKAVNVPYTQYRAVYSTKMVAVQPGAVGAATVPGGTYAPAAMPAPAAPAVSPFAAPVQQPAGWAAAGTDVPPTLVPRQGGFQQPLAPQQPVAPQQSFQQQIIPQSGSLTPGQTYAQPIPSQSGATLQQPALSPTAPPQLSPTPGPQGAITPSPSLRPIPETTPAAPVPGPRDATGGRGTGSPSPQGGSTMQQPTQGLQPVPSERPLSLQPAPANTQGLMPIVPGNGPNTATGAFPRLLEPTGHTTRSSAAASYPTAALPSRLQ